MFNQLVLVSVTPFSGTTTADKNAKMPVMLQCIAGKMPNRNVLTGTVAERAGFEVGKSYLVQVREQGLDADFGLDFNFIKIKEVTAIEAVEITKSLGQAQIITVPKPEDYKYERKGDQIKGQRSLRIESGKYTPVTGAGVLGNDNFVTEGTSERSKQQNVHALVDERK